MLCVRHFKFVVLMCLSCSINGNTLNELEDKRANRWYLICQSAIEAPPVQPKPLFIPKYRQTRTEILASKNGIRVKDQTLTLKGRLKQKNAG